MQDLFHCCTMVHVRRRTECHAPLLHGASALLHMGFLLPAPRYFCTTIFALLNRLFRLSAHQRTCKVISTLSHHHAGEPRNIISFSGSADHFHMVHGVWHPVPESALHLNRYSKFKGSPDITEQCRSSMKSSAVDVSDNCSTCKPTLYSKPYFKLKSIC